MFSWQTVIDLLWDLKSLKVTLNHLKSLYIIILSKRLKLSHNYYFSSFLFEFPECMIPHKVCNNPCSIILATVPPHPHPPPPKKKAPTDSDLIYRFTRAKSEAPINKFIIQINREVSSALDSFRKRHPGLSRHY